MRKRTLIVSHRRKEGWVVVREEVTAALKSRHATQGEAIARAKEVLVGEGGGVMRVKGKDGRFRMRRRIEGGR